MKLCSSKIPAILEILRENINWQLYIQLPVTVSYPGDYGITKYHYSTSTQPIKISPANLVFDSFAKILSLNKIISHLYSIIVKQGDLPLSVETLGRHDSKLLTCQRLIGGGDGWLVFMTHGCLSYSSSFSLSLSTNLTGS